MGEVERREGKWDLKKMIVHRTSFQFAFIKKQGLAIGEFGVVVSVRETICVGVLFYVPSMAWTWSRYYGMILWTGKNSVHQDRMNSRRMNEDELIDDRCC